MQNRREVNQDGLRPFALCAVNCKKGSKRSCGAAAGCMTSLAVLRDARGPKRPLIQISAKVRFETF